VRLAAGAAQRAAAVAELETEQASRGRTDKLMRAVMASIAPSIHAAKRLETFLCGPPAAPLRRALACLARRPAQLARNAAGA
jgi:hypothetical protein